MADSAPEAAATEQLPFSASTSAGTEFALSASLKARLLQHRIDADVAAAAAAELARRKAALEEADARLMAAVEGLGMARDDFGTATGAPLSDEAHFSSVAEAGCPDDEAAAVAYRAWEAAETKQAEAYAAREAAEAALEADYVHAQLYRCEGLGASAAALAEVHAAGLPLKAVVHVHKATEPQLLAPDGSGGPPLPDLIAELLEQQQVASTTSATAAVAVVDIAIGQLGSRFARSYAGASSLAVATGFVNIDCPARSALAHIDAAQAQTHLQELAPMPGSSGRGLPETPALSEAARGAMTSALEGHCGPANVRVECAERYAMLRAFGETLPEGVRDTHTADIVKRHHCEDLDAGQMREAIGKAQASLPEVSTSYYAPQDVLLVACHAGITQLPAGAKLPRLVSFAEYWEAFVKSGGSPPQLESRVYSLPKELADKADNIKLMYPEDGSIISTGPSSRLCVQRSSTTLSLAIEHGQPRVLATLDNGSTLLGRLRAAAGDDLATEPTLGLQCVAPTGSTVELTTSGEVLTTLPGKKPREMPPTLGVAVLGAPLEGGNVDALLADQEHAWRAVLPTGAVVTAYRSGRTRVLHPTGEVSEHTSPAATAPDMAGQSVAHWVRTNMEGAKWQTPEAEEQQSTVTVTDPDIGAKVTTRGDLVMVIDYVNGDRLVQDADGTRLTITADGAWCVEMAGVHPIRGEAAGLTVTPVPGVSMRWTAETAAITVGLPDGCLLIGSHSVVAMLPPTVPDAATPEWIVETVTSAAGHASAERQRQIKEYQEALAAKKESDRLAVEQAIAEQQVAAEAAAEAEKKKGAKKPSAKDKAEAEAAAAAAAAALEALKEQAAMVPPPPVFVQDPSGVADLVASACTGWYVFDLDVGAVSLAQADQTQVTVNSEGKVSGWPRDSPRASGEPGTPSTAAAGARVMNRSLTQAERSLRRRAPHVKPRLFVVSRSGGGYEVLDEGVFEAYRQRKAADERCNLQIQDVLGTAEPGTRAYSFLTKHTLATREVPELRIAVGATAWPATPALALPALSKPSKGFVLPRVAAYTPVAPRPPAPEPIYTFRHIMEYPALTNSDVVTLQQILQAQAAWQVHQASIGPESYMLPDTRSPEEVQQAAELAARLAAARAQRAQQQADAAQQQAAQQAQQEQEAAERLAAEQHRVGTGGAASGTSERGDAEQKPVKAKSPWPPKVVPYEDTPQRPAAGTPLPYWAAEEGLKVVEAQALAGSPQRSPARRGAPPRPMAGVYLGDSADELQEPNPPKGQQRHGQLPSLNASPRSAKLGATPANTMVPGAGGGSVRQLHPGMAEPGANPMQVSSTTGTQRGKLLDIYGKPRVAAPRMPAAYFPEEATPEVNHRYLDINEDAMRLTRTASANMIRLRGKATRQFQLTPSHLHFGTLPLGTVAHQTAHLLNVSPERARYNVLRPVLPLKVIHKMGPIAAGMEAAITVEFVPQQIGDFVGEIHINSEINTFVLTVSAKVVEAIAPQPSLATFIMPEKAAVNSVADPTVLGAEDGKSQQGDLSRRTSVPSDPAALASRSASIQSVTATVLPPMQ
ncbi:hypothetical protein WJX72_005952 [[Myrmecia] bisecta]|uniref:Uncharacterized protein n=1 Tax=[Myrmecia] bisecta TaxID=41462 RepID=A0AAW1PKC3_9CHLO